MIVKAKYLGPFPEVTVPGFAGKTAKLGEEVKLRVPDGYPLGGCWEITEGLKEYQKAIDDRVAAVKKRHEERAKKSAKALEDFNENRPDETAAYLANGEKDHTKPEKAAKPAGGAK